MESAFLFGAPSGLVVASFAGDSTKRSPVKRASKSTLDFWKLWPRRKGAGCARDDPEEVAAVLVLGRLAEGGAGIAPVGGALPEELATLARLDCAPTAEDPGFGGLYVVEREAGETPWCVASACERLPPPLCEDPDAFGGAPLPFHLMRVVGTKTGPPVEEPTPLGAWRPSPS